MLHSTYVVRELKKIAADGVCKAFGIADEKSWFGFDDPEIQWFLDRYKKKKGPAIDGLRKDYADSMDKMRAASAEGRVVLYFFPFTQKEADDILKEIGAK